MLLLLLTSWVAHAQVPTISSLSPSSGPAGTVVTVNGSNLTNIRSVVLRGIPCNITAISASQASFVVPAQASTGPVRLTTTAGNVLSSTFTVTRASSSLTYVLRSNSFNSINVGSFSNAAFTDLDHDGLIDMLVCREVDGLVSHYEQSSANSTSFTLRSANLSGLTGHYNSLVSVTDIDGDGLLDIVVGTGAGNFKHYEQATANGTAFTQIVNDFNNIFSTGGTTYQIPHFTDIDNDGLLDLLVGDEFLSRYEQTAANGGAFTQLNNQNFGPTADAGNGGSAACVTDLDGDGLLDMLIGRSNGQMFHYEQGSVNSASFSQVSTAFSGLNMSSYTTPAITDLDGDGLLDLLVGGFDGVLRHYEQAGTPVISSFTPTSGPVGQSVTITGTNLDGATAVTVNGTAGTIVGTPTATSLTFTVGAGSTTGLVRVTTPGGFDDSSTSFTVSQPPVITSFTPTSGPVGQSVTITGTNLTGATAVTVNSTAGSITANTATSLTFTVGAGSTTGLVRVTTPGGFDDSSTSFTVTASAPTITSFTPASGPVGQSVTITGTNLTGATAVTVNGTAGTIVGTPTATSLTFTVGAGSTTGLVRVTTPGGFDDSSTSFTVTYLAPTISSFTPTSGPVGTSVTITGTNLSTATAVAVNGTAGTIEGTPTATSLTFTVAAGSTTGPLSVTTPGGTATSSATYTVTPLSGTCSVPTLATAYNSDNTNRGVMFNIVATNTLTITCFDVNLQGSNSSYEIYYKPGSYVGSENNAAAWTLLGSNPAVTNVGINQPSPMGIPLAVTIPAGQTASFYITATDLSSTAATRYTNNTGYTTIASNGDLTIAGGIGKAYPFAASASNRSFNGTAHYYVGAPSTITSFTPTSGPVGTSVTITGTNLSTATAAFVNGTAGTIVGTPTATSATFTVGAGSTTGPVSLTTASGTATGGTFTVTVPAPVITNVAVPANGTYGISQNLNFTVNFDQAVTVTTTGGTPSIALTVGGTARTATYVSGSGSTALVFRYTVLSGDADANGVALGSTIALNGGTIRNAGSTNAALGLNGVASTAGVLVDGMAPTVSITSTAGASGGSTSTSPIPFSVSFSESVTGLAIADIGVTNGSKSALSGSGSGPYTFTVTPGGAGAVTVNIAAGVATDAGSNGNTAATQFSLTYAPAPTISSVSPVAELPGMPVTLTGTGFTAASTVSFGGVAAASVTFTSATSVTAIVPAGAAVGSSSVVATTSGVSSTGSPAFSVLKVYDAATSCLSTTPYLATGDGQWHYLLAANGQVVAALQDTRAALGTVSVSFQATGAAGAVRQDGRGRKYLDRNFRLSATNPTFTGSSLNVRFYGLTTEFSRLQAADASVSYASLKATQYSGANEDCQLANNDFTTGQFRVLTLTASTPGGGVPWFVAQASVADHFSEFFLTGSSAPLPVELLAFTARPQGRAVALAWRTASEHNSARFEVERSTDGQRYEQLGAVAAQGTKASPTDYAYLDDQAPNTPSPQPKVGASQNPIYYRLRQVDLDGTASYSPVRTLAVDGTAAPLALFPNPTRGAATLLGAEPGATVHIIDPLGRVVATATADASGTAQLVLPATLPAGVYAVRSGAGTLRLTIE